MTTVAEKLARRAEPPKRDWEADILPMLPADMPAPTISNGKDNDKPNVWLTFRRPYGDTRPGSAFLAQLEAAGFKTLPATLAKYGDWRRTVKLGLQDDIPETSSRSELKDCEPIAPVWIVPCQHCGPDAIAFYEKDGLTFRVSVPAPNSVGVHARRVETRGDWHFERGSGRLRFPEAWHAVTDANLTPIAQVAAHSGAYVDTEKGVSGAIYFTPFLDHADFPMTGAEFLAALEG
jgi:hypothetical protein